MGWPQWGQGTVLAGMSGLRRVAGFVELGGWLGSGMRIDGRRRGRRLQGRSAVEIGSNHEPDKCGFAEPQ